MKKYKIMFWLFFGGADQEIEKGLTKEEAEKKLKKLEKSNGDTTYSGYYIEEQ